MSAINSDHLTFEDVGPTTYTCSNCGNDVQARRTYHTLDPDGNQLGQLAVCPECGHLNTLNPKKGSESSPERREVTDYLPEPIAQAYDEGYRVMQTGAYRAGFLIWGDLFTLVADDLGSPADDTVTDSLLYLEDAGFLPEQTTPWINQTIQMQEQLRAMSSDQIRKEARVRQIIADLLLRCFYEYPQRLVDVGDG